jgi:hypothetical protein
LSGVAGSAITTDLIAQTYCHDETHQNKGSNNLKAGDKTRTCDRLITNQLLYQLSYTSIIN